MSSIAVDSLLAPVSEALPCGEDVSSGTELFVLEAEARGKPEQQFGDKIIPPVPPNWADVRDQARALLARTRDLRILMYLLRAATRLDGLAGYHDGLRVLRGLVDTRWDHVFPLPDADDRDPYERGNALAALADRASLLDDLRAARIGSDRTACTVGEVEQAFLDKNEAEAQTVRASLRERIRASCEASPAIADALTGCAAELAALEAAFDKHAAGRGPDLKPAARVLGVLASIGRGLKGEPEVPVLADGAAAGNAAHVNGAATPGAAGDLRNRADAARMLGKVCEWLEANEPGHPAPLLVRRAQRLLDMSFMEIIRDMVPESADAVERLAGGPRP